MSFAVALEMSYMLIITSCDAEVQVHGDENQTTWLEGGSEKTAKGDANQVTPEVQAGLSTR